MRSVAWILTVAACSGAPRADLVDVADGLPGEPLPTAAPREPAMVSVPAGEFWMGCSPARQWCEPYDHPRVRVYLDAFEIDAYETTIREYRACVRAGACSDELVGYSTISNLDEADTVRRELAGDKGCRYDEPDNDDIPMDCVTWQEADTYCRWRKKRLPTSAEWEKAARGTDERLYPWGNDPPTCRHAIAFEGEYVIGHGGCGSNRAWPVGSTPLGVSPYGAYDMAGNVSEWVADFHDIDYFRLEPTRNPKGPPSGKRHITRGGAWSVVSHLYLQVTQQGGTLADSRWTELGFRCAR